MKPLILVLVSCIALLESCKHANATEHRVLVNSVVAVPTAVPVAPYSPIAYSNGTAPYIPPPKDPYQKLLDDLAEQVAAKLSTGEVKAAIKQTVFAQTCAKCHTAEKANDGRPVFGPLESLSDEQIDECMDAVLNDRMPKGGKMTPEQAGELLKELSAAKKAAGVSAQSLAEVPADTPEPQKSISKAGYIFSVVILIGIVLALCASVFVFLPRRRVIP